MSAQTSDSMIRRARDLFRRVKSCCAQATESDPIEVADLDWLDGLASRLSSLLRRLRRRQQ